MMYETCREVREMIAAFLDDELPCDVGHGIQAHLDRCGPCARLAKAEEGFTAALRTCVQRIEAPAEFAETIRRRLKDPETLASGVRPQARAPRRGVGRMIRARYALAAAALLV